MAHINKYKNKKKGTRGTNICHIFFRVKSKPHSRLGDKKVRILLQAEEKIRDSTEVAAEERKQSTCRVGGSSFLLVEAFWTLCLAKGSSFSIYYRMKKLLKNKERQGIEY